MSRQPEKVKRRRTINTRRDNNKINIQPKRKRKQCGEERGNSLSGEQALQPKLSLALAAGAELS